MKKCMFSMCVKYDTYILNSESLIKRQYRTKKKKKKEKKKNFTN